MFKPIPGHETLSISLNGQLQNSDGTACALPIENRKVLLTLYGRTQWWDLEWLGLIAHYELFLPEEHQHRLFDIRFRSVNPKLRKLVCGKIPVIRRPIEVMSGYRLVLSYPHLMVSDKGFVVTVDSKEPVEKQRINNYEYVKTWTPDKNKVSSVSIHRLVAMAWVPNPDWMAAYIVNHKNGIRDHNHFKNLEWVSFTGNADHAIKTGARPETIASRVLDTETDQEHTFASQRKAAEFMGLDPSTLKTLTHYQTPGKLIKGRFEYRSAEDARPWYTRTHGKKPSGRYMIHLRYPDGRVEEHPDVRTFIRQFKVWNANSIEKIQQRFETLHPQVSFTYTDHFDNRPVQAYELSSGRVLEADGIRSMMELTGDNFNTIRNMLKGKKLRKEPQWIYRYVCDESWQIELQYDKGRPKRILATHIQTQEQQTFDSLRACAAAFDVDRDLIKVRLTTGRDHQGWVFRES